MRTASLLFGVLTLLASYGLISGRLSVDVDCPWVRVWAEIEIGAEGIVVESWGT